MNNRLRRLARNESGMTYVFIGLGFDGVPQRQHARD